MEMAWDGDKRRGWWHLGSREMPGDSGTGQRCPGTVAQDRTEMPEDSGTGQDRTEMPTGDAGSTEMLRDGWMGRLVTF